MVDKVSSSNLDSIRYNNKYAISIPAYFEDRVSITVKGYELLLVKIRTIYTSIDFSNNKFGGLVPYQSVKQWLHSSDTIIIWKPENCRVTRHGK